MYITHNFTLQTYDCESFFITRTPGYLDTVKVLVDAGADMHAVDIYLKAPLHQATLLGHFHIVKYLVEEAKAEVNQISELGKTTLVLAIEQGHLDIALYLLDHKAGT
jgi:ankyrin repeat protein